MWSTQQNLGLLERCDFLKAPARDNIQSHPNFTQLNNLCPGKMQRMDDLGNWKFWHVHAQFSSVVSFDVCWPWLASLSWVVAVDLEQNLNWTKLIRLVGEDTMTSEKWFQHTRRPVSIVQDGPSETKQCWVANFKAPFPTHSRKAAVHLEFYARGVSLRQSIAEDPNLFWSEE